MPDIRVRAASEADLAAIAAIAIATGMDDEWSDRNGLRDDHYAL